MLLKRQCQTGPRPLVMNYGVSWVLLFLWIFIISLASVFIGILTNKNKYKYNYLVHNFMKCVITHVRSEENMKNARE